jgi:hypothetical protein
LSIRPGTRVLLLAAFVLGGCGDKTPESQTAVNIGKQPKQIVDKAAADVNKALKAGTEARQEAEKKE